MGHLLTTQIILHLYSSLECEAFGNNGHNFFSSFAADSRSEPRESESLYRGGGELSLCSRAVGVFVKRHDEETGK